MNLACRLLCHFFRKHNQMEKRCMKYTLTVLELMKSKNLGFVHNIINKSILICSCVNMIWYKLFTFVHG